MIICPSDRCTGCGACAAVCPVHCITFKYDSEGFSIPFVDEDTCIKCEKCCNTCPEQNPINIKNWSNARALACCHIDPNIIRVSSSGGAFTAIASKTLSNGGIVFGCTMDREVNVFHTSISEISELQHLRGSKYVQSDVRNAYQQVQAELRKGREVLFSGCPCQIAGLYAFLGKCNMPNLTTIDLVCHGVGSPLFFQKYIQELSDTYKDIITGIEFRNKEKRSYSYVSKITFENHQPIFINALKDDYMNCFLHQAIYRECCYTCSYAKIPRVGDFTIGDFSGVARSAFKKSTIRKGVSLLLINNKHAAKEFEKISSNLISVERPLAEAVSSNLNLARPSKRPLCRSDIFKQPDRSVHELMLLYCKSTWRTKLYACIYNTVFGNFLTKIKKLKFLRRKIF